MKISPETLNALRSYPLSVKIKKVRCILNYSQKELAEKIGVSHVSVSNWEKGAFVPTGIALEKFISVCELPQDFFMDNEIERLKIK